MSSLLVLFLFLIPGSLLLLAGLTALQVFLSLRKSFWLGLILPVVNLLAIIVPLVLSWISNGVQRLSGEAMLTVGYSYSVIASLTIFSVFSLLINGITYLICRRRLQRNSQRELQKMSIQDLG